MREADLACSQSRQAPTEALHLLANADAIGGSAAAHVAGRLEPRDRAVVALLVEFIGPGELGGETGEVELLLIDLLPSANQLGSDRLTGSRRNSPDPSFHTRIVRTSVWRVNKIELLISKSTKTRSAERASVATPQTRRAFNLRTPPTLPVPSSSFVGKPSDQPIQPTRWRTSRATSCGVRLSLATAISSSPDRSITRLISTLSRRCSTNS